MTYCLVNRYRGTASAGGTGNYSSPYTRAPTDAGDPPQQESSLARAYREYEMLENEQKSINSSRNAATSSWQSPHAAAIQQRFEQLHKSSPAPKVRLTLRMNAEKEYAI